MPVRLIRTSLFFLSMFCFQSLSAQLPGSLFSRDPLSKLERDLNQRKVQEHAGFQPFIIGLDESLLTLKDSAHAADKYKKGWSFSPVASIAGGGQWKDTGSINGQALLGAVASWRKEDKWTAEIGYALAIQSPASYLIRFADSLHVLPGMGLAVRDAKNVYHSHIPFGHVGYKAGKYFHFELGRGKNFWGDGYRSLILSDNASPYPYFRITTKIWKIRYTNLFMRLDDISQGQNYSKRRGKYTALHGLSWNVSKRLNLTFFEMVVWQDRDSLSRRNLDLNYLNPVIFYRPVEFAQGSADNVLLGAGFKIKAAKKIQVYGQVVIDEFLLAEIEARRGWWANKFGSQIGLKFFDFFTPGFSLQTEFNVVRPFTYTHGSPIQAWGQLNQPLADPMGANFYEWINLMRYDYKGWTFREKFIWGAFGRDRDGLNQGGNIFRSYRAPKDQFYNEIGQGLKSTFNFHELMVSRALNKFPGWEVFLTHTWRFEKNELLTRKDQYIQVGIRVQGLLAPVTDF